MLLSETAWANGSICDSCYASKGCYRFRGTRHAQAVRFRWTVEAMRNPGGPEALDRDHGRCHTRIRVPLFPRPRFRRHVQRPTPNAGWNVSEALTAQPTPCQIHPTYCIRS